jgi:hypothetical protein
MADEVQFIDMIRLGDALFHPAAETLLIHASDVSHVDMSADVIPNLLALMP